MKKLIKEKNPILGYLIKSFTLTLIISCLLSGMIYMLLSMTGIYEKIEIILNLQYKSPIIVIPIYVFASIFVVSVIVGMLLYFHKYKRAKINSEFGDGLKKVLDNRGGK